ncbi:MAG: glycine--tRNA ligase subunit beta [Anaerolineales bacterium]
MSSSLQNIILTLQQFWAEKGCLIGQPYYTQVGAGTMNPATFLRVLGPEPWHVAYVEPSVRPDDGRYGENPNRFQLHYQFQVILKPDPGNPVELYLQSLEAIGINPREHDIRLVEDNWEQPAISAWGLGWEIWLDGQEITQFTYFQQVGGQSLDPVSVEITYGLDRILIAINNAAAIWDEPWNDTVKYGDVRRQEEFEHSKYYFEIGDVERLRQMYDLYKAEAEACIAAGLVLPAHDYVLKCSHTFNALDCRGAIGVTERQVFYGQMRAMARQVAERYLEQRKELEYPLMKQADNREKPSGKTVFPAQLLPSSFLLEIGVEELPVSDLDSAIAQLKVNLPRYLDEELHLGHGSVRVCGTPRRLAVYVETLAPRQPDREDLVKGPSAERAIGPDGLPTPAAIGFARGKGLTPKDLEVREFDGGKYVVALVKRTGRPAAEVLVESLPGLVAGLKFDKSMRWLPASGVAFSRPLRWFVALLGETVIPFEYAGLTAGRVTRGLRPYNSPEIPIPAADGYFTILKKNGIILEMDERMAAIVEGVKQLAALVGGAAILPDELLAEVANLVELPTPLLGSFDKEFLALPEDVLISVMKKHQRYFPVTTSVARGTETHDTETRVGTLLPYFVIVRNGDEQGIDLVRQGNEHVVRARFADANFFVREDLKHKLEDFRPRLATLIFQKKLGSMLDKSERMLNLVKELAPMLGLTEAERFQAERATFLSKADLVTKMVVEMTSLQGSMGREYALRDGEEAAVATAIGEQYQPIPKTRPGLALALADRLDSLTGLFAAGLAPTGTKDPFGLRRAAIGIVQPLMEHDIDLDLREAVQASTRLQPVEVKVEVQKQVLDFITGRLGVVLKDSGHKYDVVEAVLAEQSGHPAAAAKAVRQLTAWVTRPDWGMILPGYARCVRITRDQKEKFAVRPEAFVEEAEQNLYDAVSAQPSAFGGDVEALLNTVLVLIPSINTFFDKVLVMADDPAIRENRLGLLQKIAALADGVADLSKLEGF